MIKVGRVETRSHMKRCWLFSLKKKRKNKISNEKLIVLNESEYNSNYSLINKL